MRFATISHATPQRISGFGADFFRVGGHRLAGPVLLLARAAQPWGGYGDLAPLLAVAAELDVLFIGTGAATRHLPPALRVALARAGLGAEPMATPAACRSYNLLLGEGRRVGAALYPAAATPDG